MSKICKYFLKPLGTTSSRYPVGKTLMEDIENGIGLSKKNDSISKGDIFICHAVGESKLLGYCRFIQDEPVVYKNVGYEDRWLYKYRVECLSNEYSAHWWEFDLKTYTLAKEFKEEKADHEHITATGTDSLGSLQYGGQILQISKEFAEFLIQKIQDT